ncbi:MAG: hypothetical protein COT15_00095 [Candidatus Diapherotrites archaeon CG08_land_8_20_14_0_20_34_12]|nr:MAG: hypothetical protein COT15_00095 [Candidatus Diapherotrites archaeon CG08_land_8_20_14_0_20_34_12]
MRALILAAGLGKRMRPLTNEMPKAMVLLKGKPLLEHVLQNCKKAGIEECVLVVGHLKEKIIEYFSKEFEGMKLQYVEQKEMNGTAKAIDLGKEFFGGKDERFFGKTGEDFLVLSADVIVPEKYLQQLIAKKGFDAVMLAREENHPEKYGVIEIDAKQNAVLGLEEKPEKPKSNLVNAGIYKFNKKIFSAIAKTGKNPLRGEFEITDSIKILLKENAKVGFVLCKERIWDIGSLEELEKANKIDS